MSTQDYLAQRVRSEPYAVADLVLRGFTTYPFENKWRGFGRANGWFPSGARLFAIVGLLIWPWLPGGRLLLAALVFSMVPYVFTWDVSAAWRFTMHTYPIYLIAATSCLSVAWSGWSALKIAEDRPRLLALGVARMAGSLAVLVGLLVAVDWIAMPRLAEALTGEEMVSLQPGTYGDAFLGRSWLEPTRRDGVTMWSSRGETAELLLPLSARSQYEIAFRLHAIDAARGPLRVIVSVDGSRRATCPIADPERPWCSFTVRTGPEADGRATVLELAGSGGAPQEETLDTPDVARDGDDSSFGLAEIRVRRERQNDDGA